MRRIAHELEDIRPHERLAARENHDAEARPGDAVEHVLRLSRRQLIAGLAARIAIAMRAVHVAGIRRIPGDDTDLAAVAGGMAARMTAAMTVRMAVRPGRRSRYAGRHMLHSFRRTHFAPPVRPISSSVR